MAYLSLCGGVEDVEEAWEVASLSGLVGAGLRSDAGLASTTDGEPLPSGSMSVTRLRIGLVLMSVLQNAWPHRDKGGHVLDEPRFPLSPSIAGFDHVNSPTAADPGVGGRNAAT